MTTITDERIIEMAQQCGACILHPAVAIQFARALLSEAADVAAVREPVDGQWYWVLKEDMDREWKWYPAQRERNHWNSTKFSGIPLHEVKVGAPISQPSVGMPVADAVGDVPGSRRIPCCCEPGSSCYQRPDGTIACEPSAAPSSNTEKK